MANEIVLPDYLKNVVSSTAEDMIAGSGPMARLALAKKKFRFKIGKEEKEATFDPIHVAILGAQPPGKNQFIKTLFLGDYDPDNVTAPDCTSQDGIRPDASVQNPISQRCYDCKYNKFGSAKVGKGKMCSDSKHLYVVKADEVKDGQVYQLNVPASSMKNLSTYATEMAKKGVPLEAAVTQLSFDREEAYPKLEFGFAAFLNEENGKAGIERAKTKEWLEFSSSGSAGELPFEDAPRIAAPTKMTDDEALNVVSSKKDDDDLMSQW